MKEISYFSTNNRSYTEREYSKSSPAISGNLHHLSTATRSQKRINLSPQISRNIRAAAKIWSKRNRDIQNGHYFLEVLDRKLAIDGTRVVSSIDEGKDLIQKLVGLLKEA